LTSIKDKLEVLDDSKVLNQLKSDIKYANVSQYEDLIIEIIDSDGFSNPNIYIKLNESKPALFSYDLLCDFYGEDICIINGKELEKAETVTIGVYCLNDCNYKISANLQAEISISPGKMHNIYFRKDQQRIFRF
jgi:5-enolpyruvylshikimate-3-phosphate synthase